MHRSKRLLILVGVLAVVCAAAFLATRVQEQQEQVEASGETVLAIDAGNVASLAWTSGEAEYAFHKDETWIYDADEAFPVSAEALAGVEKYWRCANYLSVGQIYLRSNPLMKKDWVDEKTGETRDFGRPDVKHRLVGHWGTTPGINFLFGHVNRLIADHQQNAIFLMGPGHGGPAGTAQSLLDYVPYGPTTEGFGGTYATQENFRIMRKALDEVGEEVGRYIRLCNYSSGMCMPEIAAMGALERLDVMLNDAIYGILFRDINMQRTLVDQFMSRVIIGYCGIIFNSGEDNYLTTDDAIEAAHTVTASQFINEQFAVLANIPENQMGLGHAFEMDPSTEDGFLLELSQAQMAREIFPNARLKYMPPTKFMTGNIFRGHLQDALFNLVTVWTHQSLLLTGMLTEAVHTPLMQDRYLAIENAKYIFNNCRHLGDEVEFKKDGIIQKRAQEVLGKADELLAQVEKEGLFSTIEKGIFGGVKRPFDGGHGLEGVCTKGENYFNPFIELFMDHE